MLGAMHIRPSDPILSGEMRTHLRFVKHYRTYA